jgi:hypothetical protein
MAAPDTKVPTHYDASTEYAKIQRTQMGPRNLPPDVASRIRGRGVALEIGPANSTDPAFIALAARWGNLTVTDKMREAADIESVDDIFSLMGIERDNVVLKFLLDKKIELEREAEA